jgi:hypothetical protein
MCLLIIAIVVTSCGSDGDSTAGPDTKAEVEAAHLGYLDAYLDQAAERFAMRLAPGAVDLGGGQIDPQLFCPAHWDSVFDTEGFDAEFGGKEIEDVVDLATTRVLTKTEAEAEFGPELGDNAASFEMRSGDMLAFTLPAKGSPLTEAWGGIYRRLDGTWRVVATD